MSEAPKPEPDTSGGGQRFILMEKMTLLLGFKALLLLLLCPPTLMRRHCPLAIRLTNFSVSHPRLLALSCSSTH